MTPRSTHERETLSADIVCVGAGVASLSAVYRLLKRAQASPARKPPSVMVVEKGFHVGAHVLSGAVMDPAAFRLLLGEDYARMPVKSHVVRETFLRLTARGALRIPFTPPPMKARGFPLVSLSEVARWLGGLCEAGGAEIYTSLAAVDLIEENGRIAGVRLGDHGLDREGRPKANYRPGADLRARVVVLGEGACGYLTEKLIGSRGLDAHAHPQTYALGIKELIRTPAARACKGHVVHTFGYPLDHRTYGGGFVYGMDDEHVAVGFVVGLDYRRADLDPHELFRAFKAHPRILPYLAGGQVVAYGAKILPEGGFFSCPHLAVDGALLVGDGAGLLDSVRMKGVHLAVESGTAAGDTLYECWSARDWSREHLAGYVDRLHATRAWKDLRTRRNVRACFKYGQLAGVLATGLSFITRGLLPAGRIRPLPDHAALEPLGGTKATDKTATAAADKNLQLDRLSDLYYSGTQHEEDQPSHLAFNDEERWLRECLPVYGAPCTRYCPAQVYELEEDGSGVRIQAANCLHCKTCRIKAPLQNIEWRPPEGGGGPRYREM